MRRYEKGGRVGELQSKLQPVLKRRARHCALWPKVGKSGGRYRQAEESGCRDGAEWRQRDRIGDHAVEATRDVGLHVDSNVD